MTRKKKKTERRVPPILNTQSLIDGATDTAHNSNANRPPVYENGSGRPLFCGGSDGGDGGFRIEDAAPAGIPNSNISVAGHTNHGYSRDNGMMSPPTSGNILASEDSPDERERQEVIQVQILPQNDDSWGEAGTGNTINSDLDFTMNDKAIGGTEVEENDFRDGGGGGGTDMSRLLLNAADRSSMANRFRRHIGPFVCGLLSILAIASPVVMVALPSIGVLNLRESDLVCGVECDGMIVSLAFKLVVLALGTWAVFLRRSRATLPRIRIFRALVSLLTVVFIASFWLFYASHLAKRGERLPGHKTDHSFLQSLVQFAVNLTDSLLFVHYLAVLLMELRHTQAQYYVKVVRSPDGESKGFPIGEMSVQRTAEHVLDRYYTEFPIYNPYLDRIGSKGAGSLRIRKIYDVDGPGTNNDGNSTVVSVASKGRTHGDRLFEELEFERKVKKRKTRLIAATEDAFTHIKRMREDQQPGHESKPPMEAHEAAQAIFPTLSRSLQKYLRATRQQPRHTMESILQHLSTCLSFDMAPAAFLEKYLVETPVLQNDREFGHGGIQHWSLVSERSLYRDIQPGVAFQLRQSGDVSLLCQVERLPHFFLREEIIEKSSNRFVLRINSETSV